MRLRTGLLGCGLAVVSVAGTVVALDGGDGARARTQDDATQAPSTSTVTVERTDLEEREDLDATLGYGDPTDLAIARPGTITGLPERGAVVERGQPLAEVDGRPVPLLYGAKPLWRPLAVGTEGPDVRILEENLVALGHAAAASLTVDDIFTSATAAAVATWQEALGLEQTGIVQPTDAVVRPGAVRVSAVQAELGAPSGGPALSVTGVDRRVTLDLDAARRDLLSAGEPVEVELPDGTRVEGVVASVGTVVTPGDPMAGTSDTVEVVVTLADPASAGAYDSTPVDLSVVRSQATDVLAVPVEALLALAEGGYALEVVDGGGSRLVAVSTGAFAGGLVEVTGDVAEGDEVVVPS